MSAPEVPVAFLTLAALGVIGAIYLTSRPEKEKFSTVKKLVLHNLTRVQLYERRLGIIKPGSIIMISNPEMLYRSTWYHGDNRFLVLGGKDDLELNAAIQSGHLYIGGVAGIYVYGDVLDPVAPSDGPKELTIVNSTLVPLRLEGIPPIPPGTEVIYRGAYQGNGLDLGTEFNDLDRRFPTYQMDYPITRIEFGTVTCHKPLKAQRNISDGAIPQGHQEWLMPAGGILVPSGNLDR